MRTRQATRLALIAVIGVAALGLMACAERAVEEALEAEAGGNVDVDAEAGTLTVRGDEGEELAFAGGEGGIELPDDFPSAIPIYPDALPVQYARVGEGVQAGFTVQAPLDEVHDWYIEQLEDKGWNIEMNMSVADGSMVSAGLEGQAMSLMLGSEGGETTIIITMGES